MAAVGAPKITVAIPAYNCQETLQRAIDSVLAQTHRDFELLIVDDCSTDGTAGLLASQTDHRIRVVRHERNQGEGGARNTCFREAKYSWVAFLDSDDEWFPEKLQMQLAGLASVSNECCAIFVPYERYNLDTGTREMICETARGGDWVRHLLDKCGVGAGTTMLTSKAAFSLVGPYDTRLVRRTDHDWLLRLAAAGGEIMQWGHIPLARVYFTIKSRPKVIAESTDIFLEKHRSLFASQPRSVGNVAKAALLLQIAESCEINRCYGDWLRIVWQCLPIDPWQTFLAVLRRADRIVGRPLWHSKQFYRRIVSKTIF